MECGSDGAVIATLGGNEDLIMVYGTSTVFNPDWEGRIASDVEKAPLPPDWDRYIAG